MEVAENTTGAGTPATTDNTNGAATTGIAIAPEAGKTVKQGGEKKKPAAETPTVTVVAVENKPKRVAKTGKERAKEIADANQCDKVWENHLGEFFTRKDLALASVNQAAAKITTHNF